MLEGGKKCSLISMPPRFFSIILQKIGDVQGVGVEIFSNKIEKLRMGGILEGMEVEG